MDGSLLGSFPYGILQARILEWVATPSPRDLPDPGIEPTSLMPLALVAGFFTTSTSWEAQHCSQEEKNPFGVGNMSKVHEKIPVSENCTTCHMSSPYSLPRWKCHQGRSELHRKTYDSHS